MGLNVTYSSQLELLRYEFESCSGNAIIDNGISGFNNHGILLSGTWETDSAWGDCAIRFNSGNSGVVSISDEEIPNKMTVTWWDKISHWFDYERTIWQMIDDNNNETIFITYEHSGINSGNLNFNYRNELGNIETVLLYQNIKTTSNYDFNTFIIDYDSNRILFYSNSVLQYNDTLPSNILTIDNNKKLYIGNNNIFSQDYRALVDEFRIFSGLLNQTQINDLYNNNQITLIQTEEEEENNQTIIITNIINSIYPLDNSEVYITDNIEVTLNEKADCSLYVNNNVVRNYYNLLGFTYPLLEFEAGENKFFVYCENNNNESKKVDLSDTININVKKPNRAIQFFLYNEKNELLSNYEDLFLVTPCFQSNQLTKYYIPNEERYIKKVNNGYANFNLSYTNVYDFCLIRGRINVLDNSYTLNYHIVDIEKQIDLGKIFIGTDSFNYVLKIDEHNLYSVINPKFWGETWQNLFILILALLVGGGIIVLGIISGMVQLSVVGGVIIALGLGLMLINMIIRSIFG